VPTLHAVPGRFHANSTRQPQTLPVKPSQCDATTQLRPPRPHSTIRAFSCQFDMPGRAQPLHVIRPALPHRGAPCHSDQPGRASTCLDTSNRLAKTRRTLPNQFTPCRLPQTHQCCPRRFLRASQFGSFQPNPGDRTDLTWPWPFRHTTPRQAKPGRLASPIRDKTTCHTCTHQTNSTGRARTNHTHTRRASPIRYKTTCHASTLLVGSFRRAKTSRARPNQFDRPSRFSPTKSVSTGQTCSGQARPVCFDRPSQASPVRPRMPARLASSRFDVPGRITPTLLFQTGRNAAERSCRHNMPHLDSTVSTNRNRTTHG
jgi:hypothetical protein